MQRFRLIVFNSKNLYQKMVIIQSGSPADVKLTYIFIVITARCTIVQSAVLRLHVIRPSVCLSVCPFLCRSVTSVDQDHIGWKSWKLIARQLAQHLRTS